MYAQPEPLGDSMSPRLSCSYGSFHQMDEEQVASTDATPRRPTITVPLGIQLTGPDLAADAEMLVSLGAVIRAASLADHGLRMLYCALVGSPYATITAAGQMTNWLLDECFALLQARLGVTPDQKAKLVDQLSRLKSIAQQRNRFVHDIWAGPTDDPELVRSKRGRYELSYQPVTLDDLIPTSQEYNQFFTFVIDWILDTLGADAISIESLLRWNDAQSHSNVQECPPKTGH